MNDLESKLGAMLNNPELMKQVMSMAQSLGQEQPVQNSTPESPPPPPADSAGIWSPALLAQLADLASQSNVDSNQRRLLTALGPYLSGNRIQKLERAMRAAKLAHVASQMTSHGKP